ncbi:unnamed protein product [Vitrella brassicaformis CCMP3155]|uniref:Uncharacterized protein n=2 Tax=Vitrella brassicaformis TaxID=1169539 RepID=A0A0G4EXA6_VITBC|nr:unnamed protein product [Vitrella brassicaformis CCMP3155]|eukprot:CEM02725.1 unnamed protein product [Vitrella brassicaformis CCMP3155]
MVQLLLITGAQAFFFVTVLLYGGAVFHWHLRPHLGLVLQAFRRRFIFEAPPPPPTWPSSRLVILTAAFGHKAEWLEAAFENHRMYSSIHGYRSITLFQESAPPGPKGAYRAKLELMLELMNFTASPNEVPIDYVVWADADTIFVNCSQPIHHFIEEFPDKKALLASDISPFLFNSGVMVWSRSNFTREVLEGTLEVIKDEAIGPPQPAYKGAMPGEQISLNWRLLPHEQRRKCRRRFKRCMKKCAGDECMKLVDPLVANEVAILPNHRLQSLRRKWKEPNWSLPVDCECALSFSNGASAIPSDYRVALLPDGGLQTMSVQRSPRPLCVKGTKAANDTSCGGEALSTTDGAKKGTVAEGSEFIAHFAGIHKDARRTMILSYAGQSSCPAMLMCRDLCRGGAGGRQTEIG